MRKAEKNHALAKAVVLWIGMYLITCALFWYESGRLTTGLVFGLISASAKTVWSIVHHKIFHKPINLKDDIRV